ncbi:MAG: hypothetical protein WAU88_14295 [Candidatus Zixiibacteriota bacterium]
MTDSFSAASFSRSNDVAMGKLATIALGIFLLLTATVAARTTLRFSSPNIPRTIPINGGFVVRSDSLLLNERLLRPMVDYQWDSLAQRITLDAHVDTTTGALVVSYDELPNWVKQSVGRDIPDATSTGQAPEIPAEVGAVTSPTTPFAQTIKLSGAKSFRFSARNGGSSDFGQSIDLKIAGELAPGLELSGALSDRGYDPIYGTANSRLNELDKVDLQLASRRLLVRMGDINLPTTESARSRSVSGAMVRLNYPVWRVDATAARPRGRFTTVHLTGENGFQGPYQVTQGSGLQPVVPGSEIVWLDGRRLERGADKDYSMDYPSGQITFSVHNPVDRRSRIEMDFEPAAASYRQELLIGGGGVNLPDSSVFLSVRATSEGDDKNRPLGGDLSDADKALLSQSGDTDVYRSGVRVDSVGSYKLVTDSLPDTVYQYVGEKQGAYSITFTYRGPGAGAYRFLGAGNYQFVGEGRGDYDPIIVLPRAERREFYQAVLGVRSKIAGEILADIRQSRLIRNLWAASSNADHTAGFYDISLNKGWGPSNNRNMLSARYRLRQPQFQASTRLDSADFGRRFLLPTGFVVSRNERLGELALRLQPANRLIVVPHYADLDYNGGFSARTGGITADYHGKNNSLARISWDETSSTLPSDSGVRSGRGDNFTSSGVLPFYRNYKFDGQLEFDRRRNDYSGAVGGTQYLRWLGGVGSESESAQLESYHEDTLVAFWTRSVDRTRLSIRSVRRLDKFNYDASAGWQWLKERSGTQKTFLARSNLGYSDPGSQTQISTSYALSSELRNARGITYLEVEPGRGNYSLVAGQYVPDPDGNYLQIEEILSDRARVRRGEKSFLLSKAGKQYTVRFDANIDEELLESGKRTLAWIIPFYSDPGQDYLFLARRYNADVRFLPVGGIYLVGIAVGDDLERRTIGGSSRERRDTKGSFTLRQLSGHFSYEEGFELFRNRRDDYFAGSGDIDGWKTSARVKRTGIKVDVTIGTAYRLARTQADESAKTVSALGDARFRLNGRGEIGGSLELYSQNLPTSSTGYSYQLTDNKYGTRGALWTLSYRYSVKTNVRITASLNGRHSNDRAGRVTGRAEVVAGF